VRPGSDPTSRALRVAVLVKQVPRFEAMQLGPDGRLLRDGVDLEMNPYCRRAVTTGVRLARQGGGSCTVVTLGPPPAEDCLREAIACGATDGVLVTDPAFAGSDTLATARAAAAALRRLGPFDLVLCGRNSVDADTGQVPAELAELLDLPLLAAVRELELDGGRLRVCCEVDDGTVALDAGLPAVVSCAERLCEPAKAPPEVRAAVDPDRLRRLGAADLEAGPWGQAGSPTRVGRVRHLAAERQRLRLDGPVEEQVRRAVAVLEERRAFDRGARSVDAGSVPPPRGQPGGPLVAVLADPGRPLAARELMGAAARLAAELGGEVLALLQESLPAAAWGADAVAPIRGGEEEEDVAAEDVAAAVTAWCRVRRPWALLLPATMWGREVGSRIAARLGAGLVGDAVDLDVEDGRLVGWKPAFGGSLVAAITAASETQMATVRPGILPLMAPRPGGRARAEPELRVTPRRRVRVVGRHRDDDPDALARAGAVVAVGTGVAPDEYPALRPLLDALGAEMAATRRVTDQGWLPRSRQVGITGHSVSPPLYVALAVAGKFNHVVATRSAGTVLAINSDPAAPIFDAADVGIAGDWHEVVPLLTAAVTARSARAGARAGRD
jgi:electron transfer flavoprotein alpha subunit